MCFCVRVIANNALQKRKSIPNHVMLKPFIKHENDFLNDLWKGIQKNINIRMEN